MQQALKFTDKSLRHPKRKCLPGDTATGFPVHGQAVFNNGAFRTKPTRSLAEINHLLLMVA
ncbi:hypothetical protein RLEG3_22545 [Rhizobium leguminosarum bv. trifolii WSM1689]|nr:hypothetical protein RLEG3_22545 [Rhizobium leguminosarum bv. trifolii WSM1689]